MKYGTAAVRTWLLVAALGHLTACANQAEATCVFRYTPELRDRVVAPKLSQRFGADFVYFDSDTPGIIDRGRTIELHFVPTKSINGHRLNLYNEGGFSIVVDKCSGKFIEAFDVGLGPMGSN